MLPIGGPYGTGTPLLTDPAGATIPVPEIAGVSPVVKKLADHEHASVFRSNWLPGKTSGKLI